VKPSGFGSKNMNLLEEIMKEIEQLSKQFRDAIDIARDEGEFNMDSFCLFPLGCCGDASDLLARFLLENDIKTYYVGGTYRDGLFENTQSHAWLLTENQTIIDITGDQFKDNPLFLNYNQSVYIGAENNFYRLFDVDNIYIYEGIAAMGEGCQDRLNELYGKIIKYIP
jgi:hypothetical protein